jgi:citrate lyase subunit beta/citryl-CoA lyase
VPQPVTFGASIKETEMTSPIRPRRSVLYMPGSNARALEKAKSLPADALILDLEDAVAPDAKAEARDQVCAAVREGGYGYRELIIRINGLETPWGLDDIEAAIDAVPDAILIPKVFSGQMVIAAEKLLKDAGAQDKTKLWAMIETPLAIMHAEEIASMATNTRLECFVMGTNDLAKEVSCAQTPDRLPMVASLNWALLAGRAYDLAVIDGVFNGIGDEAGFAASCRQGAEFGFDGKTLIHPSQVEPCNAAFSPPNEDVAWGRQIIAEFDKPENASKGVMKIEGKMVERLHAEAARRLVAMADAIAARG